MVTVRHYIYFESVQGKILYVDTYVAVRNFMKLDLLALVVLVSLQMFAQQSQ